ncbi:MAG: hypothetical protein IKF60_01730 [Solobacterium sp.]|nr:hypothetical protein [Solobacterium sp.]
MAEIVKAMAKKKPAAKKKKTTAAKKPGTSIRLTAAEKKLVQNYRKCNLIEKKVIDTIVEKAGDIDLSKLLGSLGKG